MPSFLLVLRRLLVVALLLPMSVTLAAQPAVKGKPGTASSRLLRSRLQTPRASLQLFRDVLYTEPVDRDRAAVLMYHPELDASERAERAVMLKQVLDGMGLALKPEQAPDEATGKDSTEVYTPFNSLPLVHLDHVNGRWLFSKTTVEAIPKLHSRVYPFGYNNWTRDMPQFLRGETLGLLRWQYLGIGLLLAALWVIYGLLRLVLRLVSNRLTRRFGLEPTDEEAVAARRRMALFVCCLVLGVLLPMLQLPVGLARYLMLGVRIAMPLYLILTLFKVVNLIAKVTVLRGEAQGYTLNQALAPLLSASLKVLLGITGGILVLRNLEFDVTTLVAGLSVGGLALALAAQDTVKNFLGSILILLDKPFEIGDYIIFEGKSGIVLNVGLRATRVRTFDNSILYVPNAKLTDAVIENMGLRQYQRYLCIVGLTYDTPPEKIEAFCQRVRDYVITHPRLRTDFQQAFFHEYAASSLNIRINVHMQAPEDEYAVRHEVNLFLLNLAKELNVQYAYPTQMVYLAGGSKDGAGA